MKALVGLTGGIGAGKSVASRILRLQGFEVYDCDAEASRIMNSDPELKAELKQIVGSEVYDGEDRIIRPYLASIIFSEPELRLKVNQVVHTKVVEDLERHFKACSAKVMFVESAIIAISGIAEICTEVWQVTASEEERIQRVMLRSGLNREEVKARMESQKGEWMKLKELADDHLILLKEVNNDGKESLMEEILMLLNNLGVPE